MKIKFFAIVLFGLIITSCGSSKKVVRTTSTNKKTTRTVTHKPVVTTEKKTEPVKSSTQSSNETLEATSKVSATTITVTEYINQFKGVAQGNMKTYGIPASIILAQGILESGAGKGRLCLEANNHFGIKCHKEWTGPTITHDDDAAQECFRKYSDPADSYHDHALFLTSRSRYNSLFQLDKLDYKGWAEGLKKRVMLQIQNILLN
ncbi:glycoside hydrolase family 73 protein [Flavobacterium haoranii]|uniref:glycoside hydrolase family 73 protein n=1 Tax=Flavobacterium haoranii TaxID=683124 RepID=UPI002938F6E0|nr:glucosaminidase domain-containing protein [Flavobacterium haoranii]